MRAFSFPVGMGHIMWKASDGRHEISVVTSDNRPLRAERKLVNGMLVLQLLDDEDVVWASQVWVLW
jgi:hypothetical protein